MLCIFQFVWNSWNRVWRTLASLQQDVRTYTGNLIYDVRLQLNLKDRLAKKIFQYIAALFSKKLKKMSFVSDRHFRKGSVNFNFSIASMKSNYGDIFSLPTKLKFDDSSISTKLFVRQVNFFEVIRLNVEIFCAFEVRSEVTNILITRDNILHRKCIYLQKKKKIPFSSTMLSYFVKALGFTHIYLVFCKLEEKPNCAYPKLPSRGTHY